MCYSLPTFKNKVRICELLKSFRYIDGYRHLNNFCVPENNSASDIWMSAEVDTENHKHTMLYSGNGSDLSDVIYFFKVFIYFELIH